MPALTRRAKEMLVLDLYYNQDKTYRQIAKEAKICPRDIKTIIDNKEKETELIQSTSISSQAFNLFLQEKTPIQVAITLNLKEPEVHDLYRQYLSLQQLHGLYQVYEKIKDGIGPFVELYRLIEAADMDLKHVMRLLEIANNELPKVEQMHKNLLSDVINLNQKKRDTESAIFRLNGDLIYFRNSADHQRLECEKQESEKRDLYLKKIRLETVIKELQDSLEYTKIELIVKQQVNKMFGDYKQLLNIAFEAIIDSLLNNSYRLQSFIQYSMSVASTSNSLYNANHSDNDQTLSFHTKCYFIPNCDSDCIQLEHLRNLIESEKLYNQKVEELENQTICEAAVNQNN
jgi:predicted transcriptional regulator